MSRISIDESRCKGCLLCTAACPRGLLTRSGRMNPTGYRVVEAGPGRCSGCAACALVCPDLAIRVWRSPAPDDPQEPAHG